MSCAPLDSRNWFFMVHVRYWHLADINLRGLIVSFGGNAGIIGPEGSFAFDPKHPFPTW
jgi:hypothetical protein